VDVRVAGEKLRFDVRNFPAAASDSCRLLSALLGDRLEWPAGAIERGAIAGAFDACRWRVALRPRLPTPRIG
jgi:hypothetical protein